jgi:hypothetical protein
MKLCECTMGVLVCVKADAIDSDQLHIGHIVGLANPDDPFGAASILTQLKTKPGAAPQRVWPVVQFCGQHNSKVVDFNDLDLFTAY